MTGFLPAPHMPPSRNEEGFEVFQKIVVPLDLTDRHQQAIDVAAELASRSGGMVSLLHAIETIDNAQTLFVDECDSI